jgi:hypothetical protein
MDFSVKSRVWFSDRNDERGNILNEFISEQNLFILNDSPEEPTYYTTLGESFIDLTVVNFNSLNFIQNWNVLGF